MTSLKLPILIYLAKQHCPGCIRFESEWEKIKEQLAGKARFIKFTSTQTQHIPPPLQKYSNWYPSIILAGPKSYFRCFTPNDQINLNEYSDRYVIKALKFNAVETPNGYIIAGRDNTVENITGWFYRMVHNVPKYDEYEAPKSFVNLF